MFVRRRCMPQSPAHACVLSMFNPMCCSTLPHFVPLRACMHVVQITLFDCHGRENQRWELLADGSLRIPGTNRCLDVRSSGTGESAGEPYLRLPPCRDLLNKLQSDIGSNSTDRCTPSCGLAPNPACCAFHGRCPLLAPKPTWPPPCVLCACSRRNCHTNLGL